jgi:[ribosomal protein S18]-alanine N-acetyltransferase
LSEPEIAIRPATDDDLAAILALEEAGFPDPWPLETLATELRFPGSFLLVAAPYRSSALGYASFRTMADEAELLRLSVAPAARRHGLGRLLLAAGFAELSARRLASCFLEVRADNTPAIALYERVGFRLAGRRNGYFRDGSDALVYARAI